MIFNSCTCAEFQASNCSLPVWNPPPLQSAVFLNIYLCGAATATGENTHRYNSSPKNQPNTGLVSKVPIIFVWEQNTCQSLPVSSACVCLDSVFFLLKLMKLFDTKYEKHANPSPGCCHPDPAGKTHLPPEGNTAGRKAFPSEYPQKTAFIIVQFLQFL